MLINPLTTATGNSFVIIIVPVNVLCDNNLFLLILIITAFSLFLFLKLANIALPIPHPTINQTMAVPVVPETEL